MKLRNINKGNQLKFAREYRKLSRQKLAEECNITVYKIRMFELGYTDKIGSEDLNMIMDHLNFPMGFLNEKLPECKLVHELK